MKTVAWKNANPGMMQRNDEVDLEYWSLELKSYQNIHSFQIADETKNITVKDNILRAHDRHDLTCGQCNNT